MPLTFNRHCATLRRRRARISAPLAGSLRDSSAPLAGSLRDPSIRRPPGMSERPASYGPPDGVRGVAAARAGTRTGAARALESLLIALTTAFSDADRMLWSIPTPQRTLLAPS